MRPSRAITLPAAVFWAVVLSCALPGLGLAAPRSVDEPPLPDGLEDDSDDEPALPDGLEGDDEPDLPEGLGGDGDGEPDLPEGLGGDGDGDGDGDGEDKGSSFSVREFLDLAGFTELRAGARIQEDPYQDRPSLGELRIQIRMARSLTDNTQVKVAADAIVDATLDEFDDAEEYVDLREAYASFSPFSFADVKVGRQILSWGTGDLLFVNDLFPKDYQSTLLGRDIAYARAPSDAAKLSLYSDLANVDVIYVPRFNPDRYISGERISYYNPLLMTRAGQNAILDPIPRDQWFQDHEFHARLSKNIDGSKFELYGYRGFWKSPIGIQSLRPYFPRLDVYGGSLVSSLGKGLTNLEVAYYRSRDDPVGDNPFIENSQIRVLAGYERQLPELVSELTVSLQYYLEATLDYFEYRSGNIPPFIDKEQFRHVFRLRVDKMLLNQDLMATLFLFYSPTEEDGYLRSRVEYRVTDSWRAAIGVNILFGNQEYTFFNQFANNSNGFGSLRYSF